MHDSYWTHACDVDSMAEVIRDTFISLHSRDILGQLANEFCRRYGKSDGDNQVPIKLFKGLSNPFVKKLKTAGTSLTAHRSQAAALQNFRDITTFTDDEAVKQEITEALTHSESKEETAAMPEGVEDAESESGDENDKKRAAKKDDKLVKSRFIPLIDLLPPPPSKGTFRVEHIKESQYFFS